MKQLVIAVIAVTIIVILKEFKVQGATILPSTEFNSKVQMLSRAIAIAEGFLSPDGSPGNPRNLPVRANNPGDIKNGDLGYGVQGQAPGITNYPTVQAGWDALNHQVTLMLTGNSHIYKLSDSIASVAHKYAGDPNWGLNVAAALGVDASTTLDEYVNS